MLYKSLWWILKNYKETPKTYERTRLAPTKRFLPPVCHAQSELRQIGVETQYGKTLTQRKIISLHVQSAKLQTSDVILPSRASSVKHTVE
jgi:hypothetical protein